MLYLKDFRNLEKNYLCLLNCGQQKRKHKNIILETIEV